MKKFMILLVLLVMTAGLTACEDNDSEEQLHVVATTMYVGDLMRQVGGEHVKVDTLMGPGVDPHDYQPRQSDTNLVANADLLVINGLNLEEKMGDVFAQVEEDRRLILGDHVDESDLLHAGGEVDPHFWFDIDIWGALVHVAADELAALDEDNREVYEARADEYLKDLSMLDEYILRRVETLDPSDRVLITAHDAFAYFGEAYGFDVHAIQGISTESEASISDIDELAQLMHDLDVKTVFFESSVPQSTVNSLVEAAQALDHDARVGGELYSDSTGSADDGLETYIRTYRNNIDTIMDALEE